VLVYSQLFTRGVTSYICLNPLIMISYYLLSMLAVMLLALITIVLYLASMFAVIGLTRVVAVVFVKTEGQLELR